MMFPKTFHIALGSNKGDKFKNLQRAVDCIYQRIGTIQELSRIYKTPALGFDSDAFYNCCIALQTHLEPQVVLEILLDIEIVLGRTRTKVGVYEARIIDLDIVLIDSMRIATERLQVPHPLMQERKFVLEPLHDIAPHAKHPILQKQISELLSDCKDNSLIEKTPFKLRNPIERYEHSKCHYLAIEGNIGVGKTSLATTIAQDFKAKLVLERFAENPFLPKFYKDEKRYAFPLEMAFLADRHKQVLEDIAQLDVTKTMIVSDYDINKSLIFSKITLNTDEYALYKTFFELLFTTVVKPTCYVYLYQNTARLRDHIKQRGRAYEQTISNAYLEKINTGYLRFLDQQSHLNAKIIDVSERDFVHNRADYLWILDRIIGITERTFNK